jgi:AcrR family transcriptional regulator
MTGVSRTGVHGDRSEADDNTGGHRPDGDGSRDGRSAAGDPPRRRRVPALAPDERRAAIIAATIPLLRQHGLALSTKQIAEAAGVAEGTLFGVFPDKASLLQATIVTILEPGPTLDALADLRSVPDLRARLILAAKILDHSFTDNTQLFGAIRTFVPPDADPSTRDALFAAMTGARERTLAALAALVEPDRHRLRRSPESTATLLTLLLMGKLRGIFGDADPVDAAEMVSLLLDGLLLPKNTGEPAPPGSTHGDHNPPSTEPEGANG